MMVLNREQFVDFMAEKAGMTKKSCKEALDVVLEQLAEAVLAGHEVKLTGFGKIEIVDVKGRSGKINGTNWSTEDHKVAKFRITDKRLTNL